MAVVAPPIDLNRPRSRGASAPGSASPRNGPASTPGGGHLLPVAHAGFQHLQFDSARGLGEKALERDRLRNKLVDVGQRFVGFDKVIEEDTVKRRQQELKKLSAAQEGLMKLERALNCEIKRRVDANKQVQCLTEQLANDMLQRLQSNILVRIEKLAASIESLTLRCTALEKGISQFRGELPSKLQVDTAALVKEISELRRYLESDRQSRIGRDTALLRRLAEMESTEAAHFDRGVAALNQNFEQLKAEIDGLARTEEIGGMKNTLAISAQTREQTDDEIVQAMNQYTNALQKGLHAANNR
eukprot:TRINITY_DN9130_c0_g1_i2.p1 TRINITY_DN9130_c0_g1~~TRINITY_DN9130_c0_g1_i2.p1  ORF type:complete len:301 (+),score=72.32 TRINITY_DN9130_c0_g1_i2:181-1083(+)